MCDGDAEKSLGEDEMAVVDALIDADEVYRPQPEQFLAAVRQRLEQYLTNAPYRRFFTDTKGSAMDGEVRRPLGEQAERISHPTDIPPVYCDIFKQYELLLRPRSEIVALCRSSGTTGEQSQVALDRVSFERRKKVAWAIERALFDFRPNTMLLDAEWAQHFRPSGEVAFNNSDIFRQIPPARKVHTISVEGTNYAYDRDRALATLRTSEKDEIPLVVFAFPSVIYFHLHDHFDETGERFSLPAGSWLITSGGWKLHTGESIRPEVFYAFAEKMLGIDPAHVRDGYGFAEHGIIYLQCEEHRFHVPSFAQVVARDPETMEPLSDGEAGIMNFITPIAESYPGLSLLTADVGYTETGCSCGRQGTVFSVLRRVETVGGRGCALEASRLL